MTPFGLWQLARFELATLTPGLWLLLVFYALAASLFAVWLWMSGLRHVPANHAGVFTVALPVTATLIGVLALGESFTVLHALALLLASCGVVLIASGRPQSPGHGVVPAQAEARRSAEQRTGSSLSRG
ncbi:MAG: DMT family transporter [Burkholderiaceae bacterium]|nr:DMT family transporter [Burkholderiaceae bacterium]